MLIFSYFVEFSLARLPESNLLILATLNVELAPALVKSLRTLEMDKEGEDEERHYCKNGTIPK